MADEELPVLTIRDVAKLLDVSPGAISKYLAESRQGERADGKPYRYAGHPFPPPDGRLGSAPWWKPARADEIRAWAAGRAGQGAGGGPSRTLARLRLWWAELDDATRARLIEAGQESNPPESVHAVLLRLLPSGQAGVAEWGFGDRKPTWPEGVKRFLAERRTESS